MIRGCDLTANLVFSRIIFFVLPYELKMNLVFSRLIFLVLPYELQMNKIIECKKSKYLDTKQTPIPTPELRLYLYLFLPTAMYYVCTVYFFGYAAGQCTHSARNNIDKQSSTKSWPTVHCTLVMMTSASKLVKPIQTEWLFSLCWIHKGMLLGLELYSMACAPPFNLYKRGRGKAPDDSY